jgi:transposase InsO family protein
MSEQSLISQSVMEGGGAYNQHAKHQTAGRRVVTAFIATAFAQDDADAAKAQWRRVADQLRPKLPKLAAFLDEAGAERGHCRRLDADEPRIHIDLAAKGIRVGRKRVARLMSAAGLAGVSRRKFVRTTVKGSGRQVASAAAKPRVSPIDSVLRL